MTEFLEKLSTFTILVRHKTLQMCLFALGIHVILTCPGCFEAFVVVILSDRLVERLWLSKSEVKLILGPFG